MKSNIGKLVFFAFILSTIFGCASTDKINLPEIATDDIQDYKTIKVRANRSGTTDSGIFVEKGDLYSFIVTGGVSLRRWKPITLTWDGETPSEFLGVTIGNQPQNFGPINSTMDALSGGEIRFYIKDGRFNFEKGKSDTPKAFDDNSGAFDVTIIAWKTKDLDIIADFFKRSETQNPENKSLSKMHEQALHLKTVIN